MGRIVASLAVAGLATGSLALTSEAQPAQGPPAPRPGASQDLITPPVPARPAQGPAPSQPGAIKTLPTPPAAGQPEKAAGQPEKVGSDNSVPRPRLSKKITLDLRQMDLLAVLKFLGEQGGFNIVPGKNVGGRVSLAVKDITIQDALDIISLTNELAYVVQPRVVHVMTEADYQRLFGSAFADQRTVRTVHLQHADATTVANVLGNVKSSVGRVVADPQTRTLILIDVPDKLEQMLTAAEGIDRAAQLHTEAFELRYAKAADIKAELEKVLTPKLGALRLDKRTNTIVVSDLVPQMHEIKRVIGAFDRKTREVTIQASIIEVRLDDRLAIGIDWQALFSAFVNVHVRSVFPLVPAPAQGGKLTVGTFATDNFNVVLDLLQTVGKTNILSTPHITVMENEEAKVLVGTKEAYVTSAVTQTQTAATTAEQITFVDVGLQLKVLPTINPDGFITMKIRPEVSSVSRSLTTAAGNVIPIVDTSSAETTVIIKDGNTLVIAGLMKDEKVGTERKFPILADIPLLGSLFRSREDRVAKTELLFFLTPTIISGAESVSVSTTPPPRKEEDPDDEE